MDLPPEDNRLEPGHLPTPFSAVQIREASAPGRSYTFRVDPPDATAYLDRWEFIGSDHEHAERRRWTEELDGTTRQAARAVRSTWHEFQTHASYPADRTTISVDSVATPAGTFDCWVYSTVEEDGSLTAASFAKSLPGPPVLLETSAKGRVLFRMVLVETVSPA